MKRMTVILAALAATSALSTTALADNLELKRVMLSSGGVGYFEYEADVNGWETIELPVRLDQMDDVLKSIVIFDDHGGSGVVEMPSRSPLSEIFRSLPIGEEAFASTAALMNALKGAEVEVEGAVSATGRIVGAWPETQQTETGTVTRTRMAVVGDAGVQQFVLEETSSIRFLDPVLEGQVKSALAAMAQYRARDGRTLRITARGDGARRLYVGYVVEAPLWKTSYRLVSAPQGDKARMQGWAILENTSGVDWNNVELTLVTGNPVTLRQALYTAYYVDRPQVPVEVLGRVLPNVDEGSIDRFGDGRAGLAPPASPPAPSFPDASAEEAANPEDMDEMVYVTGSRIPPSETVETPVQVTFTLPNAVNVKAGESLVAPVIDRDVQAERLSHLQWDLFNLILFASVRLTNDTETSLPPGVITLFDDVGGKLSYVGDAQMATLPLGQSRLVSFAVDLKTTIARKIENSEVRRAASISEGALVMDYIDRTTTTFDIKGHESEPIDLILDMQEQAGAIVSPSIEDIELAPGEYDNFYRVPARVEAGQTLTLTIVQERTSQFEYRLVENTEADILRYIETSGPSDAVRAALEQVLNLKRNVNSIDGQIKAANSERDRIYQEQGRLRENLQAIPAESDLARRYLGQLASHEDRLAQLGADLTRLEGEKAAAEQALRDYVAALNL